MRDLSERRVLFFAPNSFGYEYEIKKEIERKGAIVEFHDERPSNASFVKALIRLNKKLIRFYTNRYFSNIISSYEANSFDYIFVLRGEALSPEILKKLRSSFPKAQLMLYLWDSIKNNNTLEIVPYFDKVFTFDSVDADKYPQLTFKPLFYLKDYQEIGFRNNSFTNDVLFVGTVHSDRYFFIKRLEKYLNEANFNTDFYFFFQSKLLYYKKRLFDKSFKGLSTKNFYFISLKKQELLKKVLDSRVMLDIQHPNQKGLTMRCIETLGAKRKLITTNNEIVKYDFYNEKNIFVISRDFFSTKKNIEELLHFIKIPYQEVKLDVYENYSIEAWIDEIFA